MATDHHDEKYQAEKDADELVHCFGDQAYWEVTIIVKACRELNLAETAGLERAKAVLYKRGYSLKGQPPPEMLG